MSRLWIYHRTWPSIARRCRDEWLPGERTRAREHVHTVQVSMFYSLPTSFSGRAPLRRCYAISNVNSRISRAPPIPTAESKKKEGGRKTSALFLGHRRQHVLMSHCSCGKLTFPPPPICLIWTRFPHPVDRCYFPSNQSRKRRLACLCLLSFKPCDPLVLSEAAKVMESYGGGRGHSPSGTGAECVDTAGGQEMLGECRCISEVTSRGAPTYVDVHVWKLGVFRFN